VVRLVNAIMGEALHSRASDIHIEPQERDLRVRYRIDGLLREVTVVPKAIQLVVRLHEAAVDVLPVLVMSSNDDRHTCDQATAAGATGFIPKPFTEDELRSEVAAVLHRRPALADRTA
jgi:CheY-like chemotaxis protein